MIWPYTRRQSRATLFWTAASRPPGSTRRSALVLPHSLDWTFALSQDFGDGLGGSKGGMVASAFPEQFNRTATETRPMVTKTIRAGVNLFASRVSLIGASRNVKSRRSRSSTTVCTRTSGFCQAIGSVSAASVPGEEHGSAEGRADDIQWNTEVYLVQHSERRPDVFALNTLMEDDALRIRARASLAGYVPRGPRSVLRLADG